MKRDETLRKEEIGREVFRKREVRREVNRKKFPSTRYWEIFPISEISVSKGQKGGEVGKFPM